MAGTVKELMDLKDEIINRIPTLSEDELILFHQFLFDLIMHVNYEMAWIRKPKPKHHKSKSTKSRSKR